MEILKQDPLVKIAIQIQVILLALPFTSFLKDKTRAYVEKYKKTIIDSFLKHPQLVPITKSISKLQTDEQLIKLLEGAGPVLSKLCPP